MRLTRVTAGYLEENTLALVKTDFRRGSGDTREVRALLDEGRSSDALQCLVQLSIKLDLDDLSALYEE